MELTDKTTRKLLNDMLNSMTSRLPPNSELFVDATTAVEFVDYLFPFIIARIKSTWQLHLSEINETDDFADQMKQRDIILKRILRICLLSGATMETSSLIVAEIIM